MKLDKEDIATAKEMATTLRNSKVSELITVGNLLVVLLADYEKPEQTSCYCPNCEALSKKLAEQEPQPVLYVRDIGGNFHEYTKEKGHTENCAAFADDCCSENHLPPSRVGVGDSNYTQQEPKREQLTDEQIRKASLEAGMQEHYMGFHSGFIRFARAIEAAHGIKGEA